MRALVLLAPIVLSFLACANSSSTEDDNDVADAAAPRPASPTQGSTTTTQLGSTSGDAGLPAREPDVDFETLTMAWNGETRSYMLGRPRGYDPNRSYPLVMAFHGNPSTKETLRKQAPFELGSKREAFLVYPDAAGGGWDLVTPTATNRDVSWIRALPSHISKSANIDLGRVYGFGFSGGAFFVSQLACRFGDLFRAISVNAGGAPDEAQSGFEKKANRCYVCPGGPVPTLVVHGNNDGQVVKTSGAFAAKCAAETNTCATNAVTTPATPSPCTKADGCAAPVELCIIPGLGHTPWSETYAKSWSFFTTAP